MHCTGYISKAWLITVPHILLTNYGEILVYVLCQIPIHYLPVKYILKAVRCLLKYLIKFSNKNTFSNKHKFSKSPTICSLIFGLPTLSNIAAATNTYKKISWERSNPWQVGRPIVCQTEDVFSSRGVEEIKHIIKHLVLSESIIFRLRILMVMSVQCTYTIGQNILVVTKWFISFSCNYMES